MIRSITPLTDEETALNAISWSDLRRYLLAFFLFLLAIWAVFNAAQMLQRVTRYYSAVPVWDYWRTVQNLVAYRRFDVAILWGQHNEHRIILPELIFAADSLLLHARQVLPIVCSIIFYLLTFWVIAASVWSDRRLGAWNRLSAILLATVVAFWQGIATILASAFLVQWTLIQLAVACALTFLAKAKESGQTKYLVLAIIAAIAGTYTSGNGLFLWPILIAAAFLIRANRTWLLSLIGAAILFGGAYFIGYHFSTPAKPLQILQHPLYFLRFMGAYLGMPFAEITNFPAMKPPQLGVYLGWINLASVLGIAIAACRQRLLSTRPVLVLFGTYAFTLCTIMITAAGRMEPTDPLLQTALAPRYLSLPLMNWAVSVLVWFWFAGLHRIPATRLLTVGAAVAALLAIGFRRLEPWLADDATYYANYQMAALGLEDGIIDASVVHRVFPDLEFVDVHSHLLKVNNLSVYYKSMGRWLGRNVNEYAGTVETPVAGAITFSYPVAHGVEIAGWADESNLRRDYKWVLLVNENGQIVGIGEKLAAGFPRDLRAFDVPPSLGWIGFVNLEHPAKRVCAYLVDNRRATLYRLRGDYELPVVQPASPDQAGTAIPGLTWSGEGAWQNGHIPMPIRGAVPQANVYTSWASSDRDIGEWHSSVFDTPPGGCLILPVLHGPRVEGLSVTVTDSDSGQVIAGAPMQDEMSDWNFWRIPLIGAVKHLRVNAYDKGVGWGEWVGVSDPVLCR